MYIYICYKYIYIYIYMFIMYIYNYYIYVQHSHAFAHFTNLTLASTQFCYVLHFLHYYILFAYRPIAVP